MENTQNWYNVTYGNSPGFAPIFTDGLTGWEVMYALTRALQFELGIAPLSDTFGDGTLAALTSFGSITSTNPDTSNTPSNIVKIAQGALYCKGYNAGNGALTGIWDATTQSAMSDLRNDLGLGPSSNVLTPKLFKFLLTMGAATLLDGGDPVVRDGQRAMNARYLSRADFHVVPADGYFLRDTHRALMFALQYEIGMVDGQANGNFGPGTKSGLQAQANLSVGSTDSSQYFVRFFHFILRVNGYSTTFTGTYTNTTAAHVTSFQNFVGLSPTGTANLATWAGLLVSTGDPDRPGSGADCVTTLTPARLTTLRNAGYQYFGRYLTNTPDHDPNKDLKFGEAAAVLAAGGKIFPIFQTGGGTPSHFTYVRGTEVAEEAAVAAWAYRIPSNAVIYFGVDYDAYDWEVTESIIPYFQGVNDKINLYGRSFRVGIYGPRNVCKRVSAAGLAVYSFVSDMSTGYSGNLGQTLPANWAFDQIQTLTLGSGIGEIEIDKNVVSGRDTAVAALASPTNVGNDPLIPASQLNAFNDAWFAHCQSHTDYVGHEIIQSGNSTLVRNWVTTHDALITGLASQYQVYKALILTPLIWEGLSLHAGDVLKDQWVRNYYIWKMNGSVGVPPDLIAEDSSAGPCQIFAATAILARNWAVRQGLLSDRIYDASVWEDMWEMWQNLADDEAFNIRTGMFVMMYYAATRTGVPATQLRNLTPSQVMDTLTGYNGEEVYGRKRMMLYYLVQRWHDDFR
ncbi:glycoside hydrolase domain-containing protein [Agromyces sp. NPDC058136]|uniref:glycoside hydrolase domain-containing protein n=1 Tax=Agromyces sp. NPDC058136 TaxID=3346354 RepID=UPI0036DA64B4